MKRASAFTLVELLLVLAILGAVAGLAIPSYVRLFSSLKLEGNARRVASALRLYHQRAITDHLDHSVEFYASDDNYKIDGLEPFDYWKIDEGVDVKNDLLITFKSLGNANPAGSVTIENKEGSRTIEVKSTTGHVRITSP